MATWDPEFLPPVVFKGGLVSGETRASITDVFLSKPMWPLECDDFPVLEAPPQ